MKSLNRTLSLVLVLCMVFGLFGVASAAKFTDYSTVKYTEAVDVMTGIGVISGMGDGTFQPAGNLTREQAAKIISYLSVGKTTADALKADSAPFTDVAKDRWSAGYIAYCVKSGILTGMGDGTFAPTANVTGYQFAKMLLVALGYDATKEGFIGSAWSINVAKLAFKLDLFDGNSTFDGNKAVTRQEACQYAFNTLTKNEVEYKAAGTTITVGGTTIVTGGSTATAVANTALAASTYNNNADSITQFCEDHFSKLKLVASTDGFKRTASKWYYGTAISADTLIGTYATVASYKFVVTNPVNTSNLDDIRKAVNTNLVIDASTAGAGAADYTTIYLNGDATTTVPGAGAAGAVTTSYVPTYGDIVEFYVETGTTNVTNVVVSRYTTAKITSNPNNNVSTADKTAGVAYYTTIGETTAVATKDTEIPGFNATTYVKDAIIAVAVNNANAILDSYVATKVTGALTAYTGADIAHATTITVDSKAYGISSAADNNLTTADFKTGVYALYMTKEGAVARLDTVSATVNLSSVYYVPQSFATADTTYGSDSYTIFAQAVTLDGTVSNVFIGALAFAATGDGVAVAPAGGYYTVSGGTATFVAAGAVLANNTKYYVAAKGVGALATGLYTFAPVTNETYKAATAFVAGGTYTVSTVASAELKTTTSKFGGNYLNSSTKFLLVKGSLSTIKTATYTGGITFADANFAGDNNLVISIKDAYNNLVASYVVIPATTTTLDSSGTTTDLLYAYNTDYSNVATGKSVAMYKMDGTAANVTIASGASVTAGTFYTYSVDTNGVYTLTPVSESGIAVDFHATGFTSGIVNGVTFSSRYNTTISGVNDGAGAVVADVEAGSTIVVDLRTSTEKASDKYTGTITNIDTLALAGSVGGIATFDAFVTSSGLKIIFITAVA